MGEACKCTQLASVQKQGLEKQGGQISSARAGCQPTKGYIKPHVLMHSLMRLPSGTVPMK